MLSLIFPTRCALCHDFLSSEETDLCHKCRRDAPEILYTKRSIPFIAKWTALWYYKDNVRSSIHRFKFKNARGYADIYARLLSRKLLETELTEGVDILTWSPISLRRRLHRGYDQTQLLAKALSRELGIPLVRTIRKIRHTKKQSLIRDAAARRANISGAYRVTNPDLVTGKRILLLDDILTTGATAQECARILLTAGAKEVYFAAIASANHNSNKHR